MKVRAAAIPTALRPGRPGRLNLPPPLVCRSAPRALPLRSLARASAWRRRRIARLRAALARAFARASSSTECSCNGMGHLLVTPAEESHSSTANRCAGAAQSRRSSGSCSQSDNSLTGFVRLWQSGRVRFLVVAAAAIFGSGLVGAPGAAADPMACDYPACTPGITPHVVLGAYCDNTTYYVFGTADYNVSFTGEPGRLMFCGSPKRLQPRWFRSPPMAGIKELDTDCSQFPEYYVAQAPDGMFLTCVAQDGHASWTRGDT